MLLTQAWTNADIRSIISDWPVLIDPIALAKDTPGMCQCRLTRLGTQSVSSREIVRIPLDTRLSSGLLCSLPLDLDNPLARRRLRRLCRVGLGAE